MDLNNISQDLNDAFKKENQITVAEAVAQIKLWIWEKNYPAAEDWIKEIEKIIPDLDDIEELKKLSRWEQSENLQKSSENLINEVESVQGLDKDDRIIACMSYIWFLAMVPLLLKQDSKLCKHHWKQWLIYAIFFFFLLKLSSLVPGLWGFMTWVLNLSQMMIAIYWGMKAYKWEMWNAPFVWEFTKKLNF